ncbi:MAG: adenosylcobinamide-GDP ribazoletransferase, partial [Armatimonadota bacterium]|nr:adenosylcobinamide-GDP ribazoletransferase [Armatimonadota bacterium]
GVARAGDGLAAQGAGGDRSRAFAMMRDPRRGTTGLVALGVVLVVKLAFLAALPTDSGRILVLAGVLGRWASAFALSAFPLASVSASDALVGRGLADAGPNEFLAATVLAIACAALLPLRGLLTLFGVALVVGSLAAWVNRRLGGFSVPLSHALGEIGEIVALACLALR